MKYEHQTIDGVLNWRLGPADRWRPFTARQLTTLYQRAREVLEAAAVMLPEHLINGTAHESETQGKN